LAGVINGDVRVDEARTACTAAARIVEAMQAELRAQKIAHEMGLDKIPELNSLGWDVGPTSK
jgi:hypothetical protein